MDIDLIDILFVFSPVILLILGVTLVMEIIEKLMSPMGTSIPNWVSIGAGISLFLFGLVPSVRGVVYIFENFVQ